MDFAYLLRMKFGTSPSEPTYAQLDKIAEDLVHASKLGQLNSQEDYFNIVKKHCPSAGTWGYKGQDSSDLNTLLALARVVAAEKDK